MTYLRALSTRPKLCRIHIFAKHAVLSTPYFPAFGLNTKIPSECPKIWIKTSPYLDLFQTVLAALGKNNGHRFFGNFLSKSRVKLSRSVL